LLALAVFGIGLKSAESVDVFSLKLTIHYYRDFHRVCPALIFTKSSGFMAKSTNSAPSIGPENPIPLESQRVLITRPAAQSARLAAKLEQLGAKVVCQPVIRIQAPDDYLGLDRSLEQLDTFQWVAFSSRNAVQFFLDRLISRVGSAEPLKALKIAAVGPATAQALTERGFPPDVIPLIATGASLAQHLGSLARNQNVLIPCGNRSSSGLSDGLTANGIQFVESIAYASTDVTSADPAVAQAIEKGHFDWITITSPAIARSTVNLFGQRLAHTQLASISPNTSAALNALGFPPAVEAREFHMDGLIEAILKLNPPAAH
jgi:uroporphyrinogen III methyltransferase/synthase